MAYLIRRTAEASLRDRGNQGSDAHAGSDCMRQLQKAAVPAQLRTIKEGPPSEGELNDLAQRS